MDKKIALISGITGQDGSFLAEFLIEKGYEVHGILRRSSSFNTGRIEHLYLDEWVRDMKKNRLVNLHYGDMTDSSSLIRIIQQVQPDEIYNLAAQSHVKVSFDVPEYTAEADAVGTLRMLEAVRILGLEKKTKIYQASTSELFGLVQEVPQKETTPFYPRSPYGVAKQYGFWITKNYRESYGMFAVNGILFNHESERRGETFVTRKITLAAARIAQGYQDKLYLGNLNSLRDWGYAKDYVECMWLILQHDTPEDFVLKIAGPDNPFAVPVAAVLGVPLYIRAETAIPIGIALMGKGMSIGAVIALIIGGAGMAIPEMSMLASIFKKRLVAMIVATIFLTAVIGGYLFNILL